MSRSAFQEVRAGDTLKSRPGALRLHGGALRRHGGALRRHGGTEAQPQAPADARGRSKEATQGEEERSRAEHTSTRCIEDAPRPSK